MVHLNGISNFYLYFRCNLSSYSCTRCKTLYRTARFFHTGLFYYIWETQQSSCAYFINSIGKHTIKVQRYNRLHKTERGREREREGESGSWSGRKLVEILMHYDTRACLRSIARRSRDGSVGLVRILVPPPEERRNCSGRGELDKLRDAVFLEIHCVSRLHSTV